MRLGSIAWRFRSGAAGGILALLGCACALSLAVAAARGPAGRSQRRARQARVFILMIWDGLRPDSVTARWTPNLFAMQSEGVRFARHHALYPTITMVNAASLATGAPPGSTAIIGDAVSLLPRLRSHRITPAASDSWASRPVNLENSAVLAALNSATFFNGALLGSEPLGQQVRRAGGYLAIVGKKGPTFIFDDSVTGDAASGGPISSGGFVFIADDMAVPESLKGTLDSAPSFSSSESVVLGMRDSYFAQIVTDRALAQAKAAALDGHPALIVFWQHNPDLTQHRRGLGTQADFDALKTCDANLEHIRRAVARLGFTDRTDLMVVSDHGFATIRATVPLSKLLSDRGLKKSPESDDVMVVANGGTDLIYLSRTAFPTVASQHDVLQKIADFMEAEPWSGPLFTRSVEEQRALALGSGDAVSKKENHDGVTPGEGPGWIAGTFSLGTLGLTGPKTYSDAPDMVVSFREMPNDDNRGLTGPGNPAYIFDAQGERRSGATNRSESLIVPVRGLMYADTGGVGGFATGLGMHAAAGSRELHNYCAAVGPDFRRGFVDEYPSGNMDLQPTIARVLGLPPADQSSIAGRVLHEALAGDRLDANAGDARLAASRTLSAVRATTTLEFSILRAGRQRWSYLDGAEYETAPSTKQITK